MITDPPLSTEDFLELLQSSVYNPVSTEVYSDGTTNITGIVPDGQYKGLEIRTIIDPNGTISTTFPVIE